MSLHKLKVVFALTLMRAAAILWVNVHTHIYMGSLTSTFIVKAIFFILLLLLNAYKVFIFRTQTPCDN